jgi:hypothetical protein
MKSVTSGTAMSTRSLPYSRSGTGTVQNLIRNQLTGRNSSGASEEENEKKKRHVGVVPVHVVVFSNFGGFYCFLHNDKMDIFIEIF